jgi:hypothetical protein
MGVSKKQHGHLQRGILTGTCVESQLQAGCRAANQQSRVLQHSHKVYECTARAPGGLDVSCSSTATAAAAAECALNACASPMLTVCAAALQTSNQLRNAFLHAMQMADPATASHYGREAVLAATAPRRHRQSHAVSLLHAATPSTAHRRLSTPTPQHTDSSPLASLVQVPRYTSLRDTGIWMIDCPGCRAGRRGVAGQCGLFRRFPLRTHGL